MKNAHVIVKGVVQGVGYRKWVKKEARKIHVTGWVRNLPDGSVEALLQGEKEMVEKLLKFFKRGSFISEVHSVDTVWEEQEELYEEFCVRHDF